MATAAKTTAKTAKAAEAPQNREADDVKDAEAPEVQNPAEDAENPATGTIPDTDAIAAAVEDADAADSDDAGVPLGIDGKNPVTPNNPAPKAMR